MAKKIISATVDIDTIKAVKKIASEKDRSFSSVVNFILSQGVKKMK